MDWMHKLREGVFEAFLLRRIAEEQQVKIGKGVPGLSVDVARVIYWQLVPNPVHGSMDEYLCSVSPLLPVQPRYFQQRRKRFIEPALLGRPECLRLQYRREPRVWTSANNYISGLLLRCL